MVAINLSEENLSKTHTKTESVAFKEGFWFHDLQGKPMWIQNVKITEWKSIKS